MPTATKTRKITAAINSARWRMRCTPAANACSTRCAYACAIDRLVRVGLHRTNLVNRLVDIGAGVGNAILARARQSPHAPAKQDDRQQHHRQTREHQQRQLEAGQHQQDQALPTPSTMLRSAIDRLEPIADSSIVVSLVRREITSPVRVTSKKPGDNVSR